MVVAAVHGQTIEVTWAIVHEALNLIGRVDSISKDNTTGLLAIVSTAAKGHEGYLVKHCVAAYLL